MDVDESASCYIYELHYLELRSHSWLQLCVWISWRGKKKRNKLCPSFNKLTRRRHVYGRPAQWRAALQSDFTSLCSVCAPTCRCLLCLSNTSASLSRSAPLLLSLCLTKCCWGLVRWPSPRLLHNSTASFPESLPRSGQPQPGHISR